MLDEKDLQAIAQLMDEKIGASEKRMMKHVEEAVSASEKRMAERMEKAIDASEARMKKHTEEAVSASEARMKKHTEEAVNASETRVTERMETRAGQSESHMLSMMEAYFEPRFNLLGEQIQLIQEKLTSAGDLETLENRVDVVEVVVKQHSREIETLKKAL